MSTNHVLVVDVCHAFALFCDVLLDQIASLGRSLQEASSITWTQCKWGDAAIPRLHSPPVPAFRQYVFGAGEDRLAHRWLAVAIQSIIRDP